MTGFACGVGQPAALRQRVDLSSRDWGIVSAAMEIAIGRERRFISDVTGTYNSSALKLKMECRLAQMVRVANSIRNQRRSLAQGATAVATPQAELVLTGWKYWWNRYLGWIPFQLVPDVLALVLGRFPDAWLVGLLPGILLEAMLRRRCGGLFLRCGFTSRTVIQW